MPDYDMLSAIMKQPDTVRPRQFFFLLALAGLVSMTTAGEVASALWVRDGHLTRQATELVSAARRVEDFGLASGDFALLIAAVDAELGRPASPRLNEAVDAVALRLVKQLHDGRVAPMDAGYALNRRRAPLDTRAALQRLATAPDVFQVLSTLEPQSAQYRALKRVLTRFRQIPADLADLSPPETRVLRAGDFYADAPKLRQLLAEYGDATASGETSPTATLYDAELVSAVTRFQQRHGLTADGSLGPKTLAALRVPIAGRIRQIELALERWRWLPDFAPPAVIVNVPQFLLYALPDPADESIGGGLIKIPVIVGQTVRQTPIFDSQIESVIFRPYWNVPQSIAREELLPLIARDLAYLARHDMEIVRGDGDDAEVLPASAASVAALRAGNARLRQRPGPNNALGLIKFVLPNPYSVYLHSTPETQLFARERRAFSHGCIRVSDASRLAAYLLKNTPGDWNADAIEAATCADRTVTVRLATPVPVYILYGTVIADPGGTVHFFDDIYGYDRRLEALLSRPRRAGA